MQIHLMIYCQNCFQHNFLTDNTIKKLNNFFSLSNEVARVQQIKSKMENEDKSRYMRIITIAKFGELIFFLSEEKSDINQKYFT